MIALLQRVQGPFAGFLTRHLMATAVLFVMASALPL